MGSDPQTTRRGGHSRRYTPGVIRTLTCALLLTGCYGGTSTQTGSNESSSGGEGTAAATTSAATTSEDDGGTTQAQDAGSSTMVSGDPDTSSSGSVGDDSSGSSTGDPGGPTSSFCACSNDNPAADAGAFEMCATMLADGGGTYYEPGPYMRTADAQTQAGVPTGSVTSGNFSSSTVYPGVTWDYWVYVPAQYDGSEPAALLVLTDGNVYQRNDGGGAYRTPTVLDNLIDEGAMPVTIAVFVDPGMNNGQSQRSLEYDTPDPNYVTFLLDDLLPAVVGDYSISADPGLRAIGGRSSGGAAAFTAGWERPDQFGLLYTTLGSFVQLRANADGEYSDKYPTEILAEDRKPLRLTLLSGINDLDNQFGNWRDAHMAMTTAVDCAGYDYRSGFGETMHGDNSHPNDEFGNDLRWLFAEAVR